MDKFVALLIAAIIAGLSPLACAIIVGFSGWIVQYALADTYGAVASYFGWTLTGWQTGAMAGFIGGIYGSIFGLNKT